MVNFGDPIPIDLWIEIKELNGLTNEFVTDCEPDSKTRCWSMIPKRLLNTVDKVDLEISETKTITVSRIGKRI